MTDVLFWLGLEAVCVFQMILTMHIRRDPFHDLISSNWLKLFISYVIELIYCQLKQSFLLYCSRNEFTESMFVFSKNEFSRNHAIYREARVR